MSGVLPDVFPGGSGSTKSSEVTVTQSFTTKGDVLSYPSGGHGGRVAVLLVRDGSRWLKSGDGNGDNPRNCAWNPKVQEFAPAGSWHVDSSCTVASADHASLHLIENVTVLGTQPVDVGGRAVAAVRLHRSGTLTITFSHSTSTTNFTEDVWWLADRGVVAKANAVTSTKQTYNATTTTFHGTGSLVLVSFG